ncbi:MAG: hypothetical protein ACREJN_09800, partial [Nitrospiraceae bacterium]
FGDSFYVRHFSDIALRVFCLIAPTPNFGEVSWRIQSDYEVSQYHQPKQHNYQIQGPPFHAY